MTAEEQGKEIDATFEVISGKEGSKKTLMI
jgi:hypothetical protein